MSTGVEIIPIFIAMAIASSIKASLFAGEKLAEKTHAKERAEDAASARIAINHNAPTSLETVMNDKDMLVESLSEIGIEHTSAEGGAIKTNIKGVELTFVKSLDGAYSAEFRGGNVADIAAALNDVSELYKQKVQQRVYDNVMSRASDKGLSLESEHTDADNAITLTFVVRRNG